MPGHCPARHDPLTPLTSGYGLAKGPGQGARATYRFQMGWHASGVGTAANPRGAVPTVVSIRTSSACRGLLLGVLTVNRVRAPMGNSWLVTVPISGLCPTVESSHGVEKGETSRDGAALSFLLFVRMIGAAD